MSEELRQPGTPKLGASSSLQHDAAALRSARIKPGAILPQLIARALGRIERCPLEVCLHGICPGALVRSNDWMAA